VRRALPSFSVLLVLALAGTAHAGADYAPGSTEWNGLSRLLDVAEQAGCDVKATDTLDWSALDAHDVLWFVYPRALVEPHKLKRWLAAGGRAVIADDFGSAGPALEALEIRRGNQSLAGVEKYNHNLSLPVAHARLQTELGLPRLHPGDRASETLVANHPSSFDTAIPATFEFAPGAALVVEGRVGKGYFVAIADPSVLINNMLELDGNLAFARALVERTCRAHQDRILLLSPTFAAHGDPQANLASPPESGNPFGRFNQMLTALNGAAKSTTTDGRALTALASFAALLALVLFAGAFPARNEIRDRWTRVSRLGVGEPPPAWERHPLAGLPWDYAQPAAILREELLDRLQAAFGERIELDQLGPQALQAKVNARFGAQAAVRAAELWRMLHRIRWRTVDGEVMPAERVARRQLVRMHTLAVEVFDALTDSVKG
jgi:hypothetical protein